LAGPLDPDSAGSRPLENTVPAVGANKPAFDLAPFQREHLADTGTRAEAQRGGGLHLPRIITTNAGEVTQPHVRRFHLGPRQQFHLQARR